MLRSKKEEFSKVAQNEDVKAHGHRMSEFELGDDAGPSDGDLFQTSGEGRVSF